VDRAHAGQQDHDRSSALDAALGSGGENTNVVPLCQGKTG